MVDALKRTRRLLKPGGWLVDIHPTADPAHVEVGTTDRFILVGDLFEPDETSGPRRRYADADAAVATVVAAQLFSVNATRRFSFRRYADTVDELSESVKGKWKGAYLTPETLRRASHELSATPGAMVWLREEVGIAKLAPSTERRI